MSLVVFAPFLNKPIFNVRETFKKAFGGVRKLFGFKTKEEREEAERRNPARAIIKYMKKELNLCLKELRELVLEMRMVYSRCLKTCLV